MPHCLLLGVNIPSLWRASTSALVKKINDLCFSLPKQRLIATEVNLNDDESTPDSLYIKSLLACADSQPYLIALVDSISTYFDTVERHTELRCQFSSGDTRDLLRFLIFISEIVYVNLRLKKSFLAWDLVESFFRSLTTTIQQPTSIIYQLINNETDQIISCCTLAKTIVSIFDYLYQRHGLGVDRQRTSQFPRSYLNLIEPDNRPLTQSLLLAFHDLDRLFFLSKQIHSIPRAYRSYLRTVIILLFRLSIFNSFVRIPTQYWEQHNQDMKKLQFNSTDYCLSPLPIDLLQHSDIMADYIERISLVGWLSRTQFQEIWVTFLGAINSLNESSDEQTTNSLTREERLEINATQW